MSGCYANLVCIKDAFADDLRLFSNTWESIVDRYINLPNNVEFIPLNPGIVINGENGFHIKNINEIVDGIMNYNYTKKVTIIATPVYFFNYSSSGRDRHHFCVMYIFIDKMFGLRSIPKISINYFNPHGMDSTRIHEEQGFISKIREKLLDAFTQYNFRINIRTNVYNGINLQKQDPMGMCIFYGFLVLTYYMDTRISNRDISLGLYNITINQLIDEILDTHIYDDESRCQDLYIIANIIQSNMAMQIGSGNKFDEIKYKKLLHYLNYDTSHVQLSSLAKLLKIKQKKYLKRNILKIINTKDPHTINKLYKIIFG